MILGFFVISLLALKALSIISVSWTIVNIISAALMTVDTCFYYHRKGIGIIIIRVTEAADREIERLQYQIDDIKDRE